MDYPLLLGGETAGKLHVERQGLYTCMEVSAEAREGLLRIWVQGGGQEAYLGLLQPGEGGMILRRRLSRQTMTAFPTVIEQASDQRLPLRKEVYITQETKKLETDAAPAVEPNLLLASAEEEMKPSLEPESEVIPESVSGQPTLVWQEHRDGSLVAEVGGQRLLALPASLRYIPPGADLRRIGGREYLVFRY